MKKKIIVAIGVLLVISISGFAQGGPPPSVVTPLDSSVFLPITMAIGIVTLLAKRKKKNKE
jgi:hypothetical protein